MAKINEIIDKIEEIAPLKIQETWDNSGWQTRLREKNIKKVMLCISVTKNVLKQTIDKNCDMLISHHPLFFNDYENPIKYELIKNHIPVYSIHTPFDKAKGGTTDSLILDCDLKIDEIVNDYTKVAYCEMTLKELVEKVKNGLKIAKVRITNYDENKVVKKVAFCAGSGTSFCEDVKGCDCFVTADLKYHTALDFEKTIIDVGHLESEKPSLNYLRKSLDMVEVEIAEEKSPIEIL